MSSGMVLVFRIGSSLVAEMLLCDGGVAARALLPLKCRHPLDPESFKYL